MVRVRVFPYALVSLSFLFLSPSIRAQFPQLTKEELAMTEDPKAPGAAAGFAVDELPGPIDVDLDFASYHSKITASANQLHYEREYIVRQVEIPADKAHAFRTLESAILTDEKGTAVLRKQ